MQQVLTIAGSDSGGGAGIQADLKTMTVLGVYGASVITAVTAQNTLGVQDFEALSANFVTKQLESVCSDLNFKAVKTGMLANSEIIKTLVAGLNKWELPNLVVDPVMVATSGDLLLAKEAITTLREELIPLAKLITPNLNEAKILLAKDLAAELSLEELAKELYSLGAEYVLVKGGHQKQSLARDVLYDGKNLLEFKVKRIETENTHGTGCTLSAAIASYLAKGLRIEAAVKKSKSFVTEAIKAHCKVGQGKNPINHLHSQN
ncbi:bifunctional hydroxymethylpyrimidine kinase/phosphomethylpyrimidine kinase [Fuchsiella alkaliacetigena]|nr:bifunctional hydroxymethylpyrimidine kinase/phosphomethylpyrimidine kinase [Fuchsiella alkaliacetigena]